MADLANNIGTSMIRMYAKVTWCQHASLNWVQIHPCDREDWLLVQVSEGCKLMLGATVPASLNHRLFR